MNKISEEYTTLFNVITDTIDDLEKLKLRLMLAQQAAEEGYISGKSSGILTQFPDLAGTHSGTHF